MLEGNDRRPPHQLLLTTYLSETEVVPRLKPEVPEDVVMSSRSPSSSIVLVSFFRPSRMVARSGESKTLPLLLSPQFNLEHSVQQRVGRSSRAITTTDFTRSPASVQQAQGWTATSKPEDLRPFRRVIAPVCPYRVDSSTRDHAYM